MKDLSGNCDYLIDADLRSGGRPRLDVHRKDVHIKVAPGEDGPKQEVAKSLDLPDAELA